ncbi:hypothetical protein MJ575_21840 [Klebsiella pneumoniae]|nr:hypothetical protein MJ575_21840 [Klebsiella pneumoniae]
MWVETNAIFLLVVTSDWDGLDALSGPEEFCTSALPPHQAKRTRQEQALRQQISFPVSEAEEVGEKSEII